MPLDFARDELPNIGQGRVNLLVGGLSLLAVSVIMMVLMDVVPCGPVSAVTAVVIVSMLTLFYSLTNSYLIRNSPDDLRKLLDENSIRSSRVAAPLLIIWVAAAQAGLPVGFSPLWVLAVFFGFGYVASIVAGARRAQGQRRAKRAAGSMPEGDSDAN